MAKVSQVFWDASLTANYDPRESYFKVDSEVQLKVVSRTGPRVRSPFVLYSWVVNFFQFGAEVNATAGTGFQLSLPVLES
jgi:hypothetical protein